MRKHVQSWYFGRLAHLADSVYELVLIQDVHGLCFPQTAGPQDFYVPFGFHVPAG